jgi:hypothetical protein
MTSAEAVELFFDALEVPDNGYYDRQSGEVDMQAADIVKALLEAGWAPPQPEVNGPSYGGPADPGLLFQGPPHPSIQNGDLIVVKRGDEVGRYRVVEGGDDPNHIRLYDDYTTPRKLVTRREDDPA